ncbi:MAG TPA: ATP-binding protein [Ktedonobacterales bacterium]|nr:ATP-binding protein [Ktedonobacterales bacterium]
MRGDIPIPAALRDSIRSLRRLTGARADGATAETADESREAGAVSWRERWNAHWFAAGPLRTFGETLLAQAPLLLWALALAARADVLASARLAGTLTVIAGPCCILYAVFRLRVPRWPWAARMALYTALGAAVAVAPALLVVTIFRRLAEVSTAPRFPWDWFFAGWTVAFTAAFLVSRLGAALLVLWNGLRRRRLLWSLTHAHLMVVVLGSALLCGILVLVAIFQQRNPVALLPVFFFFFLLTVIATLIVLPPSLLFSFLYSRRITHRIQSLAEATAALRAGDYTVRVPVTGEDEVARLQSDFNAMAADLQTAVRELRAERDTVAHLLRARRELVAAVSHELRTPVATMRGYLESTRARWDASDTPPATLRADLDVMEREAVHLEALIEDLFALARAEIGQLELRPAPLDVGALAERVVATAAPLAWRSARVELSAECATGLPAALADESRVEQILRNLLHNAVRHTPPGGIVAVAVTSEEDGKDEGVVLRVRDTGEGIAADDLPHIFERFYRAEQARAREEGGAGLGLALVKELTEAMGGSVVVESAPGEGSCFTVRLPLAATHESTGSAAIEAAVERERVGM